MVDRERRYSIIMATTLYKIIIGRWMMLMVKIIDYLVSGFTTFKCSDGGNCQIMNCRYWCTFINTFTDIVTNTILARYCCLHSLHINNNFFLYRKNWSIFVDSSFCFYDVLSHSSSEYQLFLTNNYNSIKYNTDIFFYLFIYMNACYNYKFKLLNYSIIHTSSTIFKIFITLKNKRLQVSFSACTSQ